MKKKKVEGVTTSTHLSEGLSQFLLWATQGDGAALRLGGGYLHPHTCGLKDFLEHVPTRTHNVLVLTLDNLHGH